MSNEVLVWLRFAGSLQTYVSIYLKQNVSD